MADGVDEIAPAELARWRASSKAFTLLDVREEDEVAFASIPGSTHIPMREIRRRLDELPAEEPIVVLCHAGVRSEYVVRALRAAGHPDVYNLAGGIDAYSREVDPSVPRY